MICSVFHVIKTAAVNHRVFPRDRFLAAKFLTPQRWDIIMFRYPENPATLYVMRLVGLPGETIQIEGGAVWANGKRLEIPESLGGIEYMSAIPGWPTDLWGSKDRPAVLGEDEFFVLGDFSPQSKDSDCGNKGHWGIIRLPYRRPICRVSSHTFTRPPRAMRIPSLKSQLWLYVAGSGAAPSDRRAVSSYISWTVGRMTAARPSQWLRLFRAQ